MCPVRLPKETDRPKKTPFLCRFEEEIKTLNDFYWGARAGFEALAILSNGHTETGDFLPKEVAKRWAIKVADMQEALVVESLRLRYATLVQTITYYEVYLGDILRAACQLSALPAKKPRLEIDLSALPPGELAGSFVKRLYVNHVVDELLRENYQKRPGRIAKVLNITPDDTVPPLPLDLEAVAAASEIRNCVVHAGGRADQRAVTALQGLLPGIALGNWLALDELMLFRLMKAVTCHAEAIDLLVRLQHPALS